MSFSNTLVRCREQEVEKLRKFITYSLLSSVALHIGVLAFGITNIVKNKVPNTSSRPIEITIIEAPSANLEKKPEIKGTESQGEQQSGGGGGGKLAIDWLKKSNNISSNTSNNLNNRQSYNYSPPIIQRQIPLQSQIIKPRLPSLNTTSIQPTVEKKVQEKVEKNQQQINTKKVISPIISLAKLKTDITAKIEPTVKDSINPVVNPLVIPTTIPTTQKNTTSTSHNLAKSPANFNSDRIRKLLADGRNRITGTTDTLNSGNNSENNSGNNESSSIRPGTGIGLGAVSGNGIGAGRGNGISTGTSNGVGRGTGTTTKPTEEKKVAIAERPIPKSPSSSKLDRADCQECNIRYPESARKRKIEGNPEVALDYDDKGTVTNVRLNRSSGSQELDDALLEQARNFKLKPSEGGKQGVRVSANFAIQGSQRHRDAILRRSHFAIARKKKRDEQRQQQESVSANNTTEEKPKIRPSQRVITDVSPEKYPRNSEEIPKRRININTNNQSLEETQSNRRRESNSTDKPRENRRKKPINTEQTNQSQESNNGTRKKSLGRLRDILRSRKQSESPSPNVPVMEPQPNSVNDSQTESTP
jgi:TonB family protein